MSERRTQRVMGGSGIQPPEDPRATAYIQRGRARERERDREREDWREGGLEGGSGPEEIFGSLSRFTLKGRDGRSAYTHTHTL